jgi:hypothetical protein
MKTTVHTDDCDKENCWAFSCDCCNRSVPGCHLRRGHPYTEVRCCHVCSSEKCSTCAEAAPA